jgi:CHAD domain-containing protein
VSQPPYLVRGDPGPWLENRLDSERESAHDDVLEAMDSDRYFALVDTLGSWEASPPWNDRPDRRAGKKLPKVLHREWARVEKAVKKAEAADDTERSTRLHSVRKKAKKARYAAETLEPVLGAEARDAGKTAKKIQGSLGAHHDAVVAAERVLELAQTAFDEGRDTFTFGVLSTRLQAELADHERAFRRAWKKV